MSPIDTEAARWVACRHSGRAEPAEDADFRAWYDKDARHRGAYLRAEAAWVLLDRAQVMTHGSSGVKPQPARLWAPPSWTHTSRRALLTGTLAATVAVSIGTAYVLSQRVSFITTRGELRNVPLADRSVVAINTDSQVDVALTDHLRHIQLVRGEAWFQVAKNPEAPFVVSAGDIRVRAVGTAFGVRRRDHGADVMVTEGTVETWNIHAPDQRTRLTQGNEAFVADKKAPVAVAFQPDEVTRKLAWRDREIILRQETLADAVAEFNRYNTRQIIVTDPTLARMSLVGGFKVDQPETFARAVHAALDAPVSINDDRIIIGTIGSVD